MRRTWTASLWRDAARDVTTLVGQRGLQAVPATADYGLLRLSNGLQVALRVCRMDADAPNAHWCWGCLRDSTQKVDAFVFSAWVVRNGSPVAKRWFVVPASALGDRATVSMGLTAQSWLRRFEGQWGIITSPTGRLQRLDYSRIGEYVAKDLVCGICQRPYSKSAPESDACGSCRRNVAWHSRMVPMRVREAWQRRLQSSPMPMQSALVNRMME